MNLGKIVLALGAALVGCTVGIASAKLPALTDDQKAKAAETKAKAEEAAKKDAELLGKYQDRAVDNYKRAKVQKTSTTAKAVK